MGKPTYQIGGRLWYQQELILDQDELLWNKVAPIRAMLSGRRMAAKGTPEDIDVTSVIEHLLGDKDRGLRTAAAIVLIPDGSEFDPQGWEANVESLGKISNSQISEVVSDFFGCNQGWIRRFLSIGGSPAATQTTHPALTKSGNKKKR